MQSQNPESNKSELPSEPSSTKEPSASDIITPAGIPEATPAGIPEATPAGIPDGIPEATPEPSPAATSPVRTVPFSGEEVPSRYEWNPDSGIATVQDALAIVTPVNESIQIIGHPALPDPNASLKLFLVKSSGDPFEQQDLARLIPPGDIAIAVGGYYPELHENEIPHKRNIGHACLAVGVEREVEQQVNGQLTMVKQQGVMTINNPQTYLKGAFEGGGYGCFFMQKINFPTGTTPEEVLAYEKNIVTMMAIANTFIPFADSNFNGNDPLGIHNQEKVREAGEKLILAVYGDPKAISWLRESRNTAYCAELVSAGINIGTTTLLTKTFIEQLRQRLAEQNGEDNYPDLYDVVRQRINSREVLRGNDNPNIKYVSIGVVKDGLDLQPITQRFPNADRSGTGLAFMYYDFADIAYGSIRDTYPRKKLDGLSGEALDKVRAYNAVLAKVQIEAFRQTAERFKQLAKLPPATEAAFNTYVTEEVLPAIDKVYPSEAEHDAEFTKLVQKGKQFTPTGPNGEGMFIPPDLYLLPTTGWADVYNAGVAFFKPYLRPR
ncbi:hypothetical protein IQ268_07665 [Oculatella sp. LEGE 06141]|uniref:hypothetical protein n=1 Tax=Oculatella sp. LEGE 06141 TaxID=1828648 RepID=UPI0018814C93|nr:hypothetical protein [Oculatella sp. LEGE 06141]MBE9178465.1 hypothetical protein [Oculatella sp. LEGE 06141]